MNTYHEIKYNWLIIVVFGLALIWIVIAYINRWGNRPLDIVGLIIFIILFGSCLLIFYNYKIELNNKYIDIRIGIGLMKCRIQLKDIKEVNFITNRLKYSPTKSKVKDFYSYNLNIYTLKGIEIKLKNNKAYIFSTHNCEKFKQDIEQRMLQPS